MSFNIELSSGARRVMDALTNAGYEAYLVGGAVRDALLSIPCHDSDICTNAFPEEMQAAFTAFRCIPTGLKHGTLTVLTEDGPVEVTTYRVDGAYTDHRRPDQVSFTRSLTEDLARRDLTVNAMAWNPKTGLVDPFGGREDLQNKIIRAVGDPVRRFSEDALRILRTLRFAAKLNGKIEPATQNAAFALKKDLHYVAKERIREELLKLLAADGATEVLLAYQEIICEIIPELKPCVDCVQNNPYHCYTVYEHMARSVGAVPKLSDVRMALLLHDIAKPQVKTTDEHGTDHFYGHGKRSAQVAEYILKTLRFDNKSIARIVTWILYHDTFFEYSEKILRRRVGQIGAEHMEGMLWVCHGDAMAQSGFRREEKQAVWDAFLQGWRSMQKENLPYRIQDLKINGRDLLNMGLSGPVVGDILEKLLDAVIDEELPNEKDKLIARAQEWMREIK